MAPHVPMPPFGGTTVNEKNLAAKCLQGDLRAGVQLIEALWEKGINACLDDLLRIANPTKRKLSSAEFDALCDAVDLWHQKCLVVYRRTHGIDVPDVQPESD